MRPGGDGFDFARVGREALGRDDVSAEVDGGYGQVTFAEVGVKLVVV